MNKEVQSIIRNLQNTLGGEPWFGRAVYPVLEEVDVSKVYIKPAGLAGRPGNSGHSLIELLYHMVTWAGFTLEKLDDKSAGNPASSEDLDWREINPAIHSWPAGMEEFKKIHEKIISKLETKEDDFLSGIVEDRNFNYRFLLNGLIQHNIYHLGQIAYLNKFLT